MTEQEIIDCIKKNTILIQTIPKEQQTEAVCLAIIKYCRENISTFILKSIKVQTPTICQAALEKNIWNIEHIQNQNNKTIFKFNTFTIFSLAQLKIMEDSIRQLSPEYKNKSLKYIYKKIQKNAI